MRESWSLVICQSTVNAGLVHRSRGDAVHAVLPRWEPARRC